jgi:hypothetical protein
MLFYGSYDAHFEDIEHSKFKRFGKKITQEVHFQVLLQWPRLLERARPNVTPLLRPTSRCKACVLCAGRSGILSIHGSDNTYKAVLFQLGLGFRCSYII